MLLVLESFGSSDSMKFSHLAPLLTALLRAFGEADQGSDFQEEFAGDGALTAGIRIHGFRAQRRDVPLTMPSLYKGF